MLGNDKSSRKKKKKKREGQGGREREWRKVAEESERHTQELGCAETSRVFVAQSGRRVGGGKWDGKTWP